MVRLRPRLRPALPVALALLITTFGGLFRLDAFVQKYGTLGYPGWARMLTHHATAVVAPIRPEAFRWPFVPVPYVGGDPINYLGYAREMRGFYQAHVREPVFLALTRGFLWLLSDQAGAVSFASLAGSTIAIFGTFLLVRSMMSPAAALVAALLIAGELEIITWAPDGWRDDTFMATVVLAAWAFIRFHARASFGNAVLLGAAAAAACLTRLTALSFVLPAFVWLIADCPSAERRPRARMAAVGLVVFGAFVAPYLISCALATGDPLLAINYHTGYYRHNEGLPWQQPMSAAGYLSSKIGQRPIGALDTAATGIIVRPFIRKWHGFDAWVPGLGTTLFWCALAGLLILPFSARGRLLIVILLTSLLPYALTWNVVGGGEWRFTMHTYPLYLAAAVYAVDGAVRLAVALRRNPRRLQEWLVPQVLGRLAALAALAALMTGAYLALPWLVVRETIVSGDDVSIETGGRDLTFYGAGWSPPFRDGVIVRVSRAERAIVRIPLPIRRAYDIVLRLDPVAPERQDRVAILLNRQLVGALHLAWNPERMGSYRVRLPADKIAAGVNELAIVPETVVPASSAGPRFAWIDAADRIGVRLWYVRVLRQ